MSKKVVSSDYRPTVLVLSHMLVEGEVRGALACSAVPGEDKHVYRPSQRVSKRRLMKPAPSQSKETSTQKVLFGTHPASEVYHADC